jgi:hypothetical protein
MRAHSEPRATDLKHNYSNSHSNHHIPTDSFSERKLVGPIQRPMTASSLLTKNQNDQNDLDSNQFLLGDLFRRNQWYPDDNRNNSLLNPISYDLFENDSNAIMDPFQFWSDNSQTLLQSNGELMLQQDDDIFYDSSAIVENTGFDKWSLPWTSNEFKPLASGCENANEVSNMYNQTESSSSLYTKRNHSLPWNSVLLDDYESLFTDKHNITVGDPITRSNLEMLWNDSDVNRI